MLTSKGFGDELVERGDVSFALAADVNVIAIEEILELARHLLVYDDYNFDSIYSHK